MKTIRVIAVVLVLIFIWQTIVSLCQLPAYILPGPLSVLTIWGRDFSLIATQSIPTILETIVGLILGCTLGAIAALVIAYFQNARFWLLPVLLISQAIPTFAIAPLLVIWLGYGMASKVACTVIMLFFPVTSAFYDGLRRTEPEWLDLAKTMGASKFQMLLKIRIPAALPTFGSGLRVAATIAPIGAIVGEWVGSSEGLGYLMLNANARMQINLMFASLFTIVILTLILYYSVDFSLKKFIHWQPEH